jgi:hypothetical protein
MPVEMSSMVKASPATSLFAVMVMFEPYLWYDDPGSGS